MNERPVGRQGLILENLCTGYEAAPVVNEVSLSVAPGEIVAVIGPNGAGKTTLLRAITGILPVSSGEATFDGQSLNKLAIHQISKLGIVHVMEGRGILPNLSVLDNLQISRFLVSGSKGRTGDIDKAIELFPWLGNRLKEPAGDLSGGQQQMVAIARAALANPKLLLLDEPSQGLAPILVTEIFESVMALVGGGKGVMIVEQHVQRVLDMCDRAYVVQRGRILLSGTADELRQDDQLERAYLS